MASTYACATSRPAGRLVTMCRSSPRRSQVTTSAAAPAVSGGGGGAAAPSFTTRLQHMDTVHLHLDAGVLNKYSDLDLAENELADYCSRLPPEEGSDKCWQAYSFLEQKRQSAQAGCQMGNQSDCQQLDNLNSMAHQLLSAGSMDNLVATFSTLARVEEHKAAWEARKQAQQAAQPEPGMDPLHALFVRMDRNGDGRLSVAEFRTAMSFLGDDMDGDTVSLVLDAMDVHGFIEEQQFKDIVEAERLNSHNQVANLWRHPHRSRWVRV